MNSNDKSGVGDEMKERLRDAMIAELTKGIEEVEHLLSELQS